MGLLFIQVVHDAHSCVLTMIIDTWTAVFLFLNLLELVGGNGLLSGASNSHLRYIPLVGRYLYCLAEEKQIIEKDILRVSHCNPPRSGGCFASSYANLHHPERPSVKRQWLG